MRMTTKIDGTTTTISISGWLDTDAAPKLAKVVDSLDKSVERLVIDFSEVEYISSAGLRALVAAHRKMEGNLEIINVPDMVRDVLRMAGFDRILHIS